MPPSQRDLDALRRLESKGRALHSKIKQAHDAMLQAATKFGPEPGQIKIEPLMLNVIRLLNMKGYETVASCEGHPTQGKPPYIAFAREYPFPSLPDVENIEITRSVESTHFGIRSWTENLVATSKKFMEWARFLPEL